MSNLAINKDVYFDCVRRQLKYYPIDKNGEDIPEDEYVNRYAVVRRDTGKLLGIHSDEYIVRPYYELAEKVNEVIKQTINLNKYEIEKVQYHDIYIEKKKSAEEYKEKLKSHETKIVDIKKWLKEHIKKSNIKRV